ncbi:MAG: 2-amino-4-hydroxy-6-hydroxymethyldihydropteridine diphosphokinase [Gemmatimonadales bacterium]|nr:MAG: 2-amino-4-hydroxy-6-hydroxymethyldihydropteridine diphosphokinase [Gemmatimonadales bacterium]
MTPATSLEPVPVVVAAGSNLGDRQAHLDRGLAALRHVMEVDRVSGAVDTPPEDGSPQPEFRNLVVTGRTCLSPEAFLAELLRIEGEEGRVRTVPGAARTLDLDLIFFGAAVRSGPDPIVPHPRWQRRPFVVGPLLEVAPDLVDPATGRSVRQVAESLGLVPSPRRREMASPARSAAGLPSASRAP